MSENKIEKLLSYVSVSTGTTGVATIQFWQNVDLGLGILVKIITVASFSCFLLINQDRIKEGWRKVIKIFNSK